MIISHRQKWAYFRVPKTGSTTVETILRMTGAFDQRDICSPLMNFRLTGYNMPDAIAQESVHGTPAWAIDNGLITPAQLEEYDCYAALRDPLARCVSIFCHVYAGTPMMGKEIFLKNYVHADYHKKWHVLDQHQTEWFYKDCITPVDFRSFRGMVNTLMDSIPGNTIARFPVLPNFNPTRGKEPEDCRENWIDNDPEVIRILSERFADDMALWERYYGASQRERAAA
jgi:hypothetical protein